jgi:hypothetical protein
LALSDQLAAVSAHSCVVAWLLPSHTTFRDYRHIVLSGDAIVIVHHHLLLLLIMLLIDPLSICQCLCVDPVREDFLIAGDGLGYIRAWDISQFDPREAGCSDPTFRMTSLTTWRAHTRGITSIDFVPYDSTSTNRYTHTSFLSCLSPSSLLPLSCFFAVCCLP